MDLVFRGGMVIDGSRLAPYGRDIAGRDGQTDPQALQMRTPEIQHDLPGGGRRLTQYVDGYRTTILSGPVVRRDGRDTAAWTGCLVRKQKMVGR